MCARLPKNIVQNALKGGCDMSHLWRRYGSRVAG